MKPYPEAFEEYWLSTGKRHGRRIGKRSTFREWQKVLAEGVEIEDLLRASKAYSRWCEDNERPPKDPERFLRQGIWEDFIDEPEPVEPETFVAVSLEIARAYHLSKGRNNVVRNIDNGYPSDWVTRIPKSFADEYEPGQAIATHMEAERDAEV